MFLLRRENKKRDKGERDEVIGRGSNETDRMRSINGVFATLEDAKREKGDMWSGYRYTT